jgi:hypothetical protein
MRYSSTQNEAFQVQNNQSKYSHSNNPTRYSVSRDIFQYKSRYSSTKHSVRRNIPVQNKYASTQSRIFQYKTSAVEIPKHKIFSRDIPVPNMQSAGIFQYQICSQQRYFSTNYSVSRDIFQYKQFSQ